MKKKKKIKIKTISQYGIPLFYVDDGKPINCLFSYTDKKWKEINKTNGGNK